MRFLIFFISLIAAFVAAQNANPISNPVGGTIQAGQTTTITWTPTNPGATITLVLRSGNSNNLDPGTTIVSGIPNSGSFPWNVPAGLTAGSYTIEIKDSAGGDNFSPMFGVSSNAVSASSSASVSRTSSSASITSSSSSSSTSSTSSRSSSSSSSSSRTSSSTRSSATNAPSNAAVAHRNPGAGSVAAVLGLGALVVLA